MQWVNISVPTAGELGVGGYIPLLNAHGLQEDSLIPHCSVSAGENLTFSYEVGGAFEITETDILVGRWPSNLVDGQGALSVRVLNKQNLWTSPGRIVWRSKSLSGNSRSGCFVNTSCDYINI